MKLGRQFFSKKANFWMAIVALIVIGVGGFLLWSKLERNKQWKVISLEMGEERSDLERKFPDFQKPASEAVRKRVRVVVTGDVMLGRAVNSKMKEKKDYSYPFLQTSELLREGDITLINLENPLIDPCPLTEEGMKFCAPTLAIEGLKTAGIDVAGIANNHIRNYGEEGYESTKRTLEGEGIQSVDEDNPTVIEKEGVRFGFVNFDFTTNKLKADEVKEIVARLKRRVDVAIVSCHWGIEYKHKPSESQRQMAKDLIAAGADLIVGHHPHVVQTVEEVEGKLVVYSLGNFIFDQMQSLDTRRGVVARFTFEGKRLVGYDFVPIEIADYSQPSIVSDPKIKEKILSWLELPK